jgi:flagellar basal body P-ring protein FlgI
LPARRALADLVEKEANQLVGGGLVVPLKGGDR